MDIPALKSFLVEANANGYAANEARILPERPGFQELDFLKGDWYFRDSYAGHYMAPGQEVAYFKNQPVWAMSYSGGMKEQYFSDDYFVGETFKFLKEALLEMDPDKPYRGPTNYRREEWWYMSKVKGEINDFIGNEKIYNNNILVFEQNFIGGLIIDK
ncbi:MAG: DUF5680 domain-containing protein [Patescibacteria group bacterium]